MLDFWGFDYDIIQSFTFLTVVNWSSPSLAHLCAEFFFHTWKIFAMICENRVFIPCILFSNSSLTPINIRLVFLVSSSNYWMKFSYSLIIDKVSLCVSLRDSIVSLISETLSSHWPFLLLTHSLKYLQDFWLAPLHGAYFTSKSVIHVLHCFGQFYQFFNLLLYSHICEFNDFTIFWIASSVNVLSFFPFYLFGVDLPCIGAPLDESVLVDLEAFCVFFFIFLCFLCLVEV